jgi:UDP-hydrolysing UDP-N-acetyl-D-glucosamine 2-epimerase
MAARRKICFVTGSRAEYGIIYWVLREFATDPKVELQIAVTGMHLSPEFGLTYREIERDGFKIDYKVEMLLSSDSAVAVTKSIGLGVIGFADAFNSMRPDIVTVVGDRFETFAAAQAALVARIPIAHISGGDTTEGAYDEAIRHSLTKMSHLHFVTNSESATRVRQMGENPKSVFEFGAPQLEYLHRTRLLSRDELEESFGYRFRRRNILVTFHPATLDRHASADQLVEVLEALGGLPDDVGFICTLPNADNDGRILTQMVKDFVARLGARAIAKASLGHVPYLSAMAHVDMLVGNSSSGIIEAPSYRKPSVNVGDRQRGRTRASSVIDVPAERSAIRAAIDKAFGMDCSAITNPYGEGRSAAPIAEVLRNVPLDNVLQKRFWSAA